MARLGSGELDAGEIPKDGPASQRKPFAPVMASNVVSLLANRMKLLEIAREMLHRDGPGASLIAHDRARHEARLGDPQSAATWRIIADAINHEAGKVRKPSAVAARRSRGKAAPPPPSQADSTRRQGAVRLIDRFDPLSGSRRATWYLFNTLEGIG